MAIDKQTISNSDEVLYLNVSCDQIQIAEDKLRLKLEKHVSKAKKSRDWLTCIGIFFTSLTPLVTADFKDYWIFKASQIESLFKLIAVISFVSFLFCLLRSFRCGAIVDNIIDDCKNNE